MATYVQIPSIPRVISPSPAPSLNDNELKPPTIYVAPRTRSQTARQRMNSQPPPPALSDIDTDTPDDLSSRRARTPSRSKPKKNRRSSVVKPSTPLLSNGHVNGHANGYANGHVNGYVNGHANGHANGFLRPPPSPNPPRSPSPLSLIPIHRTFNSLIHKHELPRKGLHVSIGFLTMHLYNTSTQPSQITPILLAFLVPIAAVDVVRHHSRSFNQFYIRVMGVLMRESEVNGFNGVIFYLVGAWAALALFPKDVGVMAVLLLSWCDTAASTIGRILGRHTPRIRRGKSLAGSLAAAAVGSLTALYFWGYIAPNTASDVNTGVNTLLFQNKLSLPMFVTNLLGWEEGSATIGGSLALGIMSVWTGFVGAVSEAIDLWGLDDNLTIPVLSGIGMWGFLKVFG
ncbi:MAG: hypothetical protein M1834_009683 [Cirrosporium novae-zelandiae]|nr:MAG: hypothetical protein M1834_009683 [Cirrosporium novae-zelandiae]